MVLFPCTHGLGQVSIIICARIHPATGIDPKRPAQAETSTTGRRMLNIRYILIVCTRDTVARLPY